MSNLNNKIKSYYKIFGFKETIKKIIRYIIFKSKVDKKGIYHFSCSEKKHIIFEDNLNKVNKKKYNKKICIVILNYNNKNVIFKCINSLIKYKGNYEYEIVVVDNGSTDGSYEIIKKKYKNIKLYRNSKNGCSSGRNLGYSKTRKEYILFLDSDQYALSKDWIDSFLRVAEYKDDNFGAIGWTAGWFNKKGYAFHTVDNFEFRYMPPGAMARSDIGYLGGGGMFIKKAVLEEIKGFDVKYDPTSYEDTDVSLKVRNVGKELYYCPYLDVFHDAHQTTSIIFEKDKNLVNENANYFVKKWKQKNGKLLKYKK